MAATYLEYIRSKAQASSGDGVDVDNLSPRLFDFQRDLTEWALKMGRAAIFADCGMGKTLMELSWADAIAKETGGNILLIAPLAVSHQTVREGEKFGVEVARSDDGIVKAPLTITNYEKLHLFNPADFVGAVCDESSILKSFSGVRRGEITRFMRKMQFRLLGTATAAPNDYTELGTSSEALGYLGYMDMLNKFFRNDRNNSAIKGTHFGKKTEWRLKGHAETPFWRWVTSWARALRKPSDLGYNDGDFILKPLNENKHIIKARSLPEGRLFVVHAMNLEEQREERNRTIPERCEKVAELVNHDRPALVWCHLNEEGRTLRSIIPDSDEVSGSDSDEAKERKFMDFVNGNTRVLITKPKIGGWGLNFQHCSHVVIFPSHSFEQYYQAVRRCWRFGQQNPVTVDVVLTEGEQRVFDNLKYKANAADKMFTRLVEFMREGQKHEVDASYNKREVVPAWL